jgi:hypothetical protein
VIFCWWFENTFSVVDHSLGRIKINKNAGENFFYPRVKFGLPAGKPLFFCPASMVWVNFFGLTLKLALFWHMFDFFGANSSMLTENSW